MEIYKNLNRMEYIMGTLIETWDQSYSFRHNLKEQILTFNAPGFTLTVVEEGEGDDVALLFEKNGIKFKEVCNVKEAPEIIESFLFTYRE